MRQIDPNHPYKEWGKLFVYDADDSVPSKTTSKVATLNDMRYHDLLDVLGEPTYNAESADGKVQKEWVLKYVPKSLTDTPDFYIFRLYDWKTGSSWFTMASLKEWSVGGEQGSTSIALEAIELIKQLHKIVDL